MRIRIVFDVTDRAAERLEAIADLAPGYAAALVNLAGEIRAAGAGEECEHGGEDWAHRIADLVLGARGATSEQVFTRTQHDRET